MIVCPRCQHVNPDVAGFCYFDGVALGAGDGQAHTRLPREFVFPSGRVCRTYNELAAGCQDEWHVARALLLDGTLGQFLAGVGRIDLAQAAQRARNNPDSDLGLEVFIGGLPTTALEGPRLDLHPRRISLGRMAVGDKKDIDLVVANRGKGLLIGDLSVSDSWLRLVNADGAAERASLKILDQQRFVLRVNTQGLAALRTYGGKLTVITNGGIVEVSVSVDLQARPFPHAPFAGVDRPQALAQRMHAQPKAAVPILENGEIAAWFAANGWTYPVQGPSAQGVGAVQQFFEAMGLAKPPPVALSEPTLDVDCYAGEICRGHLLLHTPARKWVYGIIEAEARWLRVLTPNVSGPQQARIDFDFQTGALAPGTYHTRLRVTANGGQVVTTQVRLNVESTPESFGSRFLRPVLAAALFALLLRLVLAIPADLYARLGASVWGGGQTPASISTAERWARALVVDVRPGAAAGAGSLERWLAAPLAEPGFVKHFAVATGWIAALLAVVLLWRRGARIIELLYGAVAGTVAGIIASASIGCLLAMGDSVPRQALVALADALGRPNPDSAWLWTPVWIALSVLCWGLMGGAAAFIVSCGGARGREILSETEKSLSACLRACGLRRLAQLLS